MSRRDLKLFLRSLAGALVLCMILALVCALAAFALMKTADNKKEAAKVALVDNVGEGAGARASNFLITAVENVYLSTLLEATRTDEETALEGVKNGDYVAAIVLPEGFIEALDSGRECKGTIYLSDKARTQADMIESIVRFGTHILLAGQIGVFAGEDLIEEDGIYKKYGKQFTDDAYGDLLSESLTFNTKYFVLETVGYHGTGMPTESYFALCWLLLLLFLISLFFIPLFLTDCNQGMLNRLFAYGVGPVRFMSGKLILMAASRAVILAAVLLVMQKFGLVYFTVPAVISAVVGVIYITFVGAALTMCFGDGITGNVISGVLGMFLCGGIVPRPMLPELVLDIGRFTPFGAAKAFLEPMFGADFDIAAMIAAVVYAALAVWLMGNKITRTMAGRD